MEGGAVGHNFERDPPRDHPCQVWFNLAGRLTYILKFFCEMFLSTDLYWLYKLEIFWLKITFKSSQLKLLNQIKTNLAGMVLVWFSFNIHIILKVGHPKIISTQISEQKILMWSLSHNIPKRNKLAEKISQKNPEYMKIWVHFD
jgi:hypothetical protein